MVNPALDHPGRPVPEETTPLDFYGAEENNGGRGTDNPGGRHPNWTNGAPTPTTPPRFFAGWMPFLLPNQQHQSTEGIIYTNQRQIKY